MGFTAVAAPLLATDLLDSGGPALLWSCCSATAIALAAVQPALSRLCVSRPLDPVQ